MLSRAHSLGLIGLVGLVVPPVLATACATSNETPRVSVDTNLALPKGVLDRVTKLSLTVLEGSVTCDAAAGQTALPDGPTGAKEIARRELATTGCAAGVKFCGDLTIEKSDAVRVFSAVAKGSDDGTLAIGCAQAKVDQDALPLAIKMFRYLAPADCSDTILQPTEQCTTGGTAVC